MLRILQNTHIDFIKARRITTMVVLAFIVPALCYVALFVFALVARRAKVQLADEPAAATIH